MCFHDIPEHSFTYRYDEKEILKNKGNNMWISIVYRPSIWLWATDYYWFKWITLYGNNRVTLPYLLSLNIEINKTIDHEDITVKMI